jgi:hypothetical protein
MDESRFGQLASLVDRMEHTEEAPRYYIGASIIGSDCLRQIWYESTGQLSSGVPNRTRRTWKVGSILEHYVVGLLEEAGLKIERPNEQNNYWSVCDKTHTYFQGHFDGVLVEKKAILEIKTAKDSSFKIFIKSGCKKWNPKYYAQIQSYMGMSGMNLAYIVVFNKDTSEIFDECISFDPDFYQELKDKAKMIYSAISPPPRINGSPIWYQCKTCKFNKVCHE